MADFLPALAGALALGSNATPPAVPSAEAHYPVVTLEVSGDPTYTIELGAGAPGRNRSRDERETREWVAVRTSARGEDRIASRDCPAVRTAVLAFADLPALSPAAVSLLDTGEDGAPSFPPVMLHGFPTRISWTADDLTRVETTRGFSKRTSWSSAEGGKRT